MHADELIGIPLFEGLNDKQCALLAPLFRRVSFAEGETVFEQGDTTTDIYVLESGEITIQHDTGEGGTLGIATIRPSSVFGWSAALGRSEYSSAAICRTNTQALAIRGNDLHEVLRTDSELGKLILERMAATVANRFEEITSQLTKLLQGESDA